MKVTLKASLILVAGLLTLGVQDVVAQNTFWTDDFESTGPSPSGARDLPNWGTSPEDTDGFICNIAGDYFVRTDDATGLGAFGNGTAFIGKNGTYLWRAEDMNGTSPCVNPDVINWTDIDITGRTNLEFSGYFAARVVGAVFENADDYIIVEHSIDGAPFTIGLQFSGDSGTPAAMATDPNFDGDGVDGVDLTETLTFFNYAIAGTGNTLALRVRVSMEGGGEEVAFDWFRLSEGTAPVELESYHVD